MATCRPYASTPSRAWSRSWSGASSLAGARRRVQQQTPLPTPHRLPRGSLGRVTSPTTSSAGWHSGTGANAPMLALTAAGARHALWSNSIIASRLLAAARARSMDSPCIAAHTISMRLGMTSARDSCGRGERARADGKRERRALSSIATDGLGHRTTLAGDQRQAMKASVQHQAIRRLLDSAHILTWATILCVAATSRCLLLRPLAFWGAVGRASSAPSLAFDFNGIASARGMRRRNPTEPVALSVCHDAAFLPRRG